MPMTIQVMGLAQSAALNSQAAAVAIDQIADRPSQAVFARATANVTAPIAPAMPSTARATRPTARVIFGNSPVQRVNVDAMPVRRSIRGVRSGISAWPNAIRRACTAAPNCCQGSTMAEAICSAVSSPRTWPSFSMPLRSWSVSPMRRVSSMAASPPNAWASASELAATLKSPKRPLSCPTMSSIGSSRPVLSVNDMPRVSEAAPMFSKNAL